MSHAIHLEIDEQFADRIDPSSLLHVAELTLAACGEEAGHLTIVITDDATVQALNLTYRGIDAPTDVLSFANQDPLPTGASVIDAGQDQAFAEADGWDEEAWHADEIGDKDGWDEDEAWDSEDEDSEDEDSEDEDSEGEVFNGPLPDAIAVELADYLGDIIIAYPYAEQQAAVYGNNIDAELRLLTVHGVLHLLGYDHDTKEDEAAMWALQRQVLAHYGDDALTNRIYQLDSVHE